MPWCCQQWESTIDFYVTLQDFTRLYCLAQTHHVTALESTHESRSDISNPSNPTKRRSIYIYIYIRGSLMWKISKALRKGFFEDFWDLLGCQVPSHQAHRRPLLGWCIQRHGQTAEATSAQKEVRVAQGFHSSQVPEHPRAPQKNHTIPENPGNS